MRTPDARKIPGKRGHVRKSGKRAHHDATGAGGRAAARSFRRPRASPEKFRKILNYENATTGAVLQVADYQDITKVISL